MWSVEALFEAARGHILEFLKHLHNRQVKMLVLFQKPQDNKKGIGRKIRSKGIDHKAKGRGTYLLLFKVLLPFWMVFDGRHRVAFGVW